MISKGKRRAAIGAGFLALALSLPGDSANGHGINGHIWVSDGALDWMQNCEAVEQLKHPEIRPVLQIGAAFPDSGYALDEGREYGETAHWEPFVQAYVDEHQARYDEPFTTDALRSAAFLLGLSAHGMEDEVFDTVFLRLSYEAEGSDQDILDPATDFMLIADGHTDLKPPIYYPEDFLLDVFSRADVNVEVTPGHFERGMFIIHTVVIGLVGDNRSGLDDIYRYDVPWAAAHYVDTATPSSLEFEKRVVGPYFDALWKRLTGTFTEDDLILETIPSTGYRLGSNDPASVNSWITVFFGKGVEGPSVTQERVRLVDASGNPVPIELGGTRWGGLNTVGRIVQIKPQVTLESGAAYTVEIDPGIELIDKTVTKQKHSFTVQSACENSVACKPLPAPAEPKMCPAPVIEEPAALPVVEPSDGCASGGNNVPVWLGFMAGLWLLRRGRRLQIASDSPRPAA